MGCRISPLLSILGEVRVTYLLPPALTHLQVSDYFFYAVASC
jgi:hypothetical protein